MIQGIGRRVGFGILVLGVAGAEGARLEEPVSRISLEVPAGFATALDREGRRILLKGPGNLRVICEALRPGPDPAGLAESDRARLAERFGPAGLVVPPGPRGRLGGRPAISWAAAASQASVELRAWLARGPGGDGWWARVAILGTSGEIAVHRDALRALLDSLVWGEMPATTGRELEREPARSGGNPAGVEAKVAVSPERSPGSAAGPVGEGTPGSGATGSGSGSGSVGDRAGGAGDDDPASEGPMTRPRGRHDAFDRGSLSGGVGFLAEAAATRDPELDRRLLAAFSVDDRSGRRDEAETRKAAGYLGFGAP